MEERQIMKFKDEEGNLVELEAVARVYIGAQEDMLLAPLDEAEEEFVFRVDHDENGQEVYNSLESDEEFLQVKKEYSRLLYDAGKGESNE